MVDTLNTFSEITSLNDDDLLPVKRGTGDDTDHRITSQNLKQAVAGSEPADVIYGGSLIYGSVTWLTGLIFDVSAASFVIDGTTYFSDPDTVTLATADATNPRIDVIYVDTGGLVGAITGTPAASPPKP